MNEQSKRNFKIGVIAILHESNTFIDYPTELKHFKQNILCDGEDVLLAFRDSNHEVGGFLDVLDPSNECTPVGVFAARAMPYGVGFTPSNFNADLYWLMPVFCLEDFVEAQFFSAALAFALALLSFGFEALAASAVSHCVPNSLQSAT